MNDGKLMWTSEAALRHVLALIPESASDVIAGIESADEVVAQALRHFTHRPGASMLAAAWLSAKSGWLSRVGDARVWQLCTDSEQKFCRPLTQDKTYIYTKETPPDDGKLTDPACMIGSGAPGQVEVWPIPPLAPSECLLFASDGLHKGVSDLDIVKLLTAAERPFDSWPKHLCEAARASGSTATTSLHWLPEEWSAQTPHMATDSR